MSIVNFKPVSKYYKIAEKVFEEQSKRILEAIPNADVQHIGSTIIPGSLTKGDLDINVRVFRTDFLTACKKLEEFCKIDPNNRMISTKASFIVEQQELPVGIQLTVFGSKYDNFVKQRDLFLLNRDLVIEYNKLKQRFEGRDMDEYRTEKSKFFDKIMLANKL